MDREDLAGEDGEEHGDEEAHKDRGGEPAELAEEGWQGDVVAVGEGGCFGGGVGGTGSPVLGGETGVVPPDEGDEG